MSCTVVSLPVLLLAGVISGIGSIIDSREARRIQHENVKQSIIQDIIQNQSNELSEETIQKICREYKTVFMDENVLVKTLDEYGIHKMEVVEGRIIAHVDNFVVEFYKNNENEPYTMNIKCNQDCNDEKFVNDINEEYAGNVQEETYMKLKERLNDKNMEIESEEVLEDNSIMITVNLG